MTMTVLRTFLGALLLLSLACPAAAHEDYGTWRRQDNTLCCGDKDCYETQAKNIKGTWWALRREDQQWLEVSPHLIIHGAAKDGQAHLCAPPPPSTAVYCFMMEAMGG